MKNGKKLALVALALFSSSQAFADKTYVGMGYHQGTFESNAADLSSSGIKLEVAKYFNPYLAVEGQVLLGFGDDSATIKNNDQVINANFELKNAISLFVKGEFPIYKSLSLYGLAGYTRVKIETSTSSSDSKPLFDTGDDSGFAYGAGAGFGFGNNLYLSAEYVLYAEQSSYEYSGLNIGLHKKF